ncbi:MAG: hypothetical protein ABS43_14480 [Bordetella sp. SCN 67-23]|nr:GntR family transcriptional regulator [Burkholderiales bacterium]ODS73165.1 MAG: hypothetical protein ABS43_14480 [Bordetella sp. SCN 67-23]ODU91906.1 MAG: hypothetical protein ABT00_05980 [Bordetella sp. SCN 68-11]OJW95114.1 MAG: hypothetical protein BGO71_03445 [Burkholderiales bacterium 67-32]
MTGAAGQGVDPVGFGAPPAEDRPQVQSVSVYEKLRLAIVSGELRPNEPLIEDSLSQRYGISRTPLREAIQRLAADGLLTGRKRGWAVREFTADEIRENYEARAGLEGLACRFAAERGTDEEHRRIATLHERRSTMAPQEPGIRIRTNREFHDSILDAAHNDRLRHLIFLTGNFYLTRRVATTTSDEQYRRAQSEHGTIVRAILERNGPAASEAMMVHIMNAFETWKRFNAD